MGKLLTPEASVLGASLFKSLQGLKKVMRRCLGRRQPSPHGRPVCVLFVQDQAQTQTGSPQVLIDLLTRLNRSRYRPLVLCSEAGELTRVLEGLGLPYHMARLVPLSARSAPAFVLNSLGLALLMVREQVDLVHINSPLWRSGVVWASHLLGIPVIQHVHTLWPEIEIDEPYFLPRVARIVACSHGATEGFARRRRFVPKIRVVYNGIDLERIDGARERLRSEYGLRSDHLLVGVVGTLKPIKGQEVFLQMTRRVLDAGIGAYFFIVGADPLPGEPYLRKLHAMVEDLELKGKVWFTGFRKDNLDVVRSLDILVSASREEAMGRTLIEAMAMGLPVVATRIGGMPEVVEDGVTGIIVPPGDSRAMAEAVLCLARDPSLRNRFGKAGRRRVEKKFSLDHMIKGIESIYEELLR